MKAAIGVVLSLALFSTSALADSSLSTPGKPAGVRHAQTWDNTSIAVVGGFGVAALVIGLAVSYNGPGAPPSNNSSTTTTSGTTS